MSNENRPSEVIHTCPESDPGPDDITPAAECKACHPDQRPNEAKPVDDQDVETDWDRGYNAGYEVGLRRAKAGDPEAVRAQCTDNAISGRCQGLRERAPLTHVAVKDEQGAVWSLPRPFRHHHVLKVMHDHGAKQDKAEPADRQGFLDAHGHYLTRKQALVNATRHNQLKGGKTIASILTSEDLW